MTVQETFQKLAELRMHGLARALKEQLDRPDDHADLGFEERIGLLVDREWTEREGRGLTRRLQLARLRDRTACIEDVDFQHPRGLDRAVLKRLATGECRFRKLWPVPFRKIWPHPRGLRGGPGE